MSYDIIEASVYDGDLIEIYEFTLQTDTWRQTSSSIEYEHDGNWYLPRPLQRSKLERTGEMNRMVMKIETDAANPVVELFVRQQPREQIGVRIFQGHRGDEFVLIFSGRVLSCAWGKDRRAELTCEPAMTAFKRQSLKYNFGKNCPYVLYSSRCRAIKYPLTGTIASKTLTTVSVTAADAIPDGRLQGGIIMSGVSSRTILKHVGAVLTLSSMFDNAEVGDDVLFYLGCNKTTTACKDWHDNIANFGGEPYTPYKNPFRGKIAK